MADLKGLLSKKALLARQNIATIAKAYDTFNEAAPKHAADVTKMGADIGEMQDDLDASTRILGNSSVDGESAQEEPPRPRLVGTGE